MWSMEQNNESEDFYDVGVPIALLPTLGNHPDVGRIEFYAGPQPAEFLLQPTRAPRFAVTPTPAPSGGGSVGPSSSGSPTPKTTTRTTSKRGCAPSRWVLHHHWRTPTDTAGRRQL